jgi:hypothetical protein
MIIAVIVLGPISEQDAIRYLSLYSITISVIVDLIVSIVLMCRVMVSSKSTRVWEAIFATIS